MEFSDFIEKVVDIFDDVQPDDLTPDTKFREMDEWSSLAALGLIAMADEEYDVELKGDELKKAETLGDIFEVIKGKL